MVSGMVRISRDKGERDSGVTAGRLDQHALAGRDFARALGVRDHANADAVFHAAARVEAFKLGHDGGLGPCSDAVQTYQGSFSNQFGNIVGDLH
jgi:hypothetical protein